MSHCSCVRTDYRDGMLICSYAKHWLMLIEQSTDCPVDYDRSKSLYERVQKKLISEEDEHQIELDVPRTFPEEPFFGEGNTQGRQTLKVILKTLCKHSSSAGYTQGMNFIVATLLFHCGEVLAFEMTIRALNDYALKAVYMSKLPGLYFHCEVIQALMKEELPELVVHFKNKIDLMVVCQTWIMCIFTQVIPLNQV